MGKGGNAMMPRASSGGQKGEKRFQNEGNNTGNRKRLGCLCICRKEERETPRNLISDMETFSQEVKPDLKRKGILIPERGE